jgi:lipopolysaccharide export system permease protein
MTDPANLRIQLQLRNGSIHDLAKQGEDYQIMKFDRYDLTLNIPGTDQLKTRRILKPREMSVSELQQQIKENEKRTWKDDVAKVELSKRFSIPLTCILFGIVGVPLGITSRRSGKSGGFIFAVLIILMYYVGLILMQNFGRSGKINPYFSVWIPNIVLLFFTIYVSYKTQKEMPFRTLNKINEIISTLWEYLLKKIGSTEIHSETNNSSKTPD